jgi:hypothetical protein
MRFWQSNTMRGDLPWKKFTMIVNMVRKEFDATLDEIADTINTDWSEGAEHDTWLKTARASEIADWLVAGMY